MKKSLCVIALSASLLTGVIVPTTSLASTAENFRTINRHII